MTDDHACIELTIGSMTATAFGLEGLRPKPPKFEHIFVAIITFLSFLLY